jgi:chromosome partitioning protein
MNPYFCGMAKTIAIANQKGGVGKTTTAINLGGCLGVLEYKTLIIDADPQANSTSGLGFDPRSVNSIYDCLVNNVSPSELILETNTPNLFLLPSHIDLVGAELEMINLEDREFRLKNALAQISNQFDVILIDCSPSLGLITVNSLVAADSVLIPVQCEYFALEGLSKLINTIKIVQGRLNPSLDIEGMLLTMYDTRLRLANQVVDEVKTHFQTLVFDTIIHRNTTLSESSSHGIPVIMHDASSKGAINYLNLAREILQNNNLTKMGNAEKQIDFETDHEYEQ